MNDNGSVDVTVPDNGGTGVTVTDGGVSAGDVTVPGGTDVTVPDSGTGVGDISVIGSEDESSTSGPYRAFEAMSFAGLAKQLNDFVADGGTISALYIGGDKTVGAIVYSEEEED